MDQPANLNDNEARDDAPDSEGDIAAEAAPSTTAPDGTTDDGMAAESQSNADDADHDDESNPNREAAKWRRKLRAAEKQLADTTSRLELAQRQIAEIYAADHLLVPAAMWHVAELSQLVDDAGRVDKAAVKQACELAKAQLGVQPRRMPVIDSQGRSAHLEPSAAERWREAFVTR